MKDDRRIAAFTLIELLVTITLIAVLARIAPKVLLPERGCKDGENDTLRQK
jgi:prepilin-type N-terminal cleavage/methylation domain-containing protein